MCLHRDRPNSMHREIGAGPIECMQFIGDRDGPTLIMIVWWLCGPM